VLWSVVAIAAVLLATGVPYPTYFAGAQFIHFLLGPAVVALAWPLWQRRAEVRRRWGRLLLAALAGGVTASASALALGWAVGLPSDVLLSLVPKSVTAPVAMGIAEKIGGIPALSAVFAVITGLVGALSGKYLFAALRIPATPAGWAARGFAMGTVSHGIGAARALQVDADAGAYAGLALGLQVALASLLVPLAFTLFKLF
jgi:putative effector of murein hydrolase